MTAAERARLLAQAEDATVRVLELIDSDELERAEGADRVRHRLLAEAFAEPVPPEELQDVLEQVERLYEMDRCVRERVDMARRRLAASASDSAQRRRAVVAYAT